MVLSPYFWSFVALAPVIYWLLPDRFRFWFFSLSAALLIAVFDQVSALVLGLVVVSIHVGVKARASGWPGAGRLLFAIAVAVLAVLIAFKLAIVWRGALALNWGVDVWLPLGISYFSFKAVHFIIELHRGRVETYSFALFATYMFIPTAFSAGPIQRYDRFVNELSPRFTPDHLYYGATRVAYGLIKQFVIVGMLINLNIDSGDAVLKEASRLGTLNLWLYLTLYYLTLYLNFSAYTDIAIGTSRVFGFRIMENFNFPVLATSIDDFWRRWHMTLTNWCREYVYQPVLGLWRRPMIASYATFIVIGLWHEFSLTRLLWGLLHGSALVGYFAWKRTRGRKPRARLAEPRSVGSVARDVGGWAATQAFVIASMCALVVQGNDLTQVGRLFLRLFFIPV